MKMQKNKATYWLALQLLHCASFALGQGCTSDVCISCQDVGQCQDGSIMLTETCIYPEHCIVSGNVAECHPISEEECKCSDSSTCKPDFYNETYFIDCSDQDNPAYIHCAPPQILDLESCDCVNIGTTVKCPSYGDSRCLSCASFVDCTTGTPVETICPENKACAENPLLSPPAFCSLTPQLTPNNSNCFCSTDTNGVYEDPYTIYSYVRCNKGVPKYVECPPSQAYIDSKKSCVPVPECTMEETLEIPLSCSSMLNCVFEYGDYAGYLDECESSGEIFNEYDSDFCYVPAVGVCSGPGNIADPYKCNVWHQCLNSSEPTISSCCPEDMVYLELLDSCESGQCSPSGLCIQEYWEQSECHACQIVGEKYATDNICTPYYFECYLGPGSLEVRLTICPTGELFDQAMNSCTSTTTGC